jgi:choline transporter-like protein 2/4/5
MDGRIYQLQSQIPGNGPCYPNLFDTKQFFYRCARLQVCCGVRPPRTTRISRVHRGWPRRCFPDFPSNLTTSLINLVGSAASSLTDSSVVKNFVKQWNSSSARWSRYVGDISRGVLVIVIAGLVGGLIFSLVSLQACRSQHYGTM